MDMDEENLYCRLCLKSILIDECHDLDYFLHTNYNQLTVEKLVKEVTSVQIYKDDCFSQKICMECLKKLKQFYEFKLFLKTSQDILSNLKILFDLDPKDEIKRKLFNECDLEIILNGYYKTTNPFLDSQEFLTLICSINPNCKKQMSFSNYVNHLITTHHLECCIIRFSSVLDLIGHIHNMHSPVIINRLCKFCSKKFSDRKSLTKHLKNVHISKSKVDDKSMADSNEDLNINEPLIQVDNSLADEKSTTPIIKEEGTNDNNFLEFNNQTITNNEKLNLVSENNFFSSEEDINDEQVCADEIVDEHKLFEIISNDDNIVAFDRIIKIQWWEKLNLSNVSYKCDFCTNYFYIFDCLKTHVREVHRKHLAAQPSTLCEICGLLTTRPYALRRHFLTHSEKKVETTIEIIDENSSGNWWQKLNSQNLYKCNRCNETFYTTKLLTKHIDHFHKPKFKNAEEISICHTCDKSFHSKKSLTRHMKLHRKKPFGETVQSSDSTTSKVSKLVQLYKKTKTKPALCDICGYSSHNHQNVLRHIRDHSDEYPFECSDCNEKFKGPELLKSHRKFHSEANRKYQCPFCDFKTFTAGSLLSHRKNIHMPKKIVQCDICDKKVTHLGLRTHIRDCHSGTYICDKCPERKVYTSRKNYNQHMRLHFVPFECVKCGQTFRKKITYNRHIFDGCTNESDHKSNLSIGLIKQSEKVE